MWPYRLHPIVLVYLSGLRPIEMPIHCWNTHRPCSIYQNHCGVRKRLRVSVGVCVQFMVSNFEKEKKKRKRNEKLKYNTKEF